MSFANNPNFCNERELYIIFDMNSCSCTYDLFIFDIPKRRKKEIIKKKKNLTPQ